MEKNRLKDIKEIIIAFLLAIVFIFSQFFAYYQGVIFGADNHEIVEEVKDEVFNKKQSNRRLANYTGTVVPNSGYVENVYFNTTLSTEEVVGLLNQLTYTNTVFLDIPVYGLLYKHHDDGGLEWLDLILVVFKFDDFNYAILDFDNEFVYFSSMIMPDSPFTFVGWNSDFNGDVVIEGDVLNQLQDIPFGNENDKLTSLFSITPFEQDPVEDKPLFFEQFIEDASDIVLGFITILVNATVSLTDIMYNESTNQLTIVGSAFALALAVGVVYLFFRLIRGLIKSNNRG